MAHRLLHLGSYPKSHVTIGQGAQAIMRTGCSQELLPSFHGGFHVPSLSSRSHLTSLTSLINIVPCREIKTHTSTMRLSYTKPTAKKQSSTLPRPTNGGSLQRLEYKHITKYQNLIGPERTIWSKMLPYHYTQIGLNSERVNR